MTRKKLPYLLQGEFSRVKNSLKKMYQNKVIQLKSDEEWYKNVIVKPDEVFSFLYDENFIYSDLQTMYNFIKPSQEEIRYVEEKYGENHPYFVVIEYLLIPLYQRAYEKAILELEVVS